MKRVEWFILGAGLLVLPFIFSLNGEQMREPKAHFFVCLMGLLLCARLAREVSWSLAAGGALCYLSAFLVRFFPIEETLTLSAALGSCLLFTKAKKDDVERLFEFFEWAGMLAAAYAMCLQLKNADPILTIPGSADFHRVSVFFGQHTLYGPFCVGVGAIALFRDRFLRFFLISIPILWIDASFTYLALLVVVTMYLIMRFGRRAVLGLTLAGILGTGIAAMKPSLLGESLNDNGRFPLWQITYSIAKARPWLGHGYSSFSQQFPAFQSKEIRQANGIQDEKLSPEVHLILAKGEELRLRSGLFISPHNEYLGVFYEFGTLGILVLVVLLLSFTFWWLVNEDTRENWALGAVFFSFLANGLGNFPFHLIPQALLPLWAFVLVTTSRDRSILEP